MANQYINTTIITDANSLQETVWTDQNEVYKAQYNDSNNSHSKILNYHFARYPHANAEIYEFLKKENNNLIEMCYTYSVEDKANIDSIARVYFLENFKNDKILIKEEQLNVQTLEIGTIIKYAYDKDDKLSYMFEYFPDGKLFHIINFSDSEDDLMDFDDPLKKIDWSQISVQENAEKYYADGLS